MSLIKDWKKAWRFSSVRIAIVVTVLGFLQAILPEFKEYWNPEVFAYVNAVLGVAIIVARIVKQNGLEETKDGTD